MKKRNPFQGDLTDEEWKEIVCLDYILTWGEGYTKDYKNDLKRYKELVYIGWKIK